MKALAYYAGWLLLWALVTVAFSSACGRALDIEHVAQMRAVGEWR